MAAAVVVVPGQSIEVGMARELLHPAGIAASRVQGSGNGTVTDAVRADDFLNPDRSGWDSDNLVDGVAAQPVTKSGPVKGAEKRLGFINCTSSL